jgi:hypothetical protein
LFDTSVFFLLVATGGEELRQAIRRRGNEDGSVPNRRLPSLQVSLSLFLFLCYEWKNEEGLISMDGVALGLTTLSQPRLALIVDWRCLAAQHTASK